MYSYNVYSQTLFSFFLEYTLIIHICIPSVLIWQRTAEYRKIWYIRETEDSDIKSPICIHLSDPSTLPFNLSIYQFHLPCSIPRFIQLSLNTKRNQKNLQNVVIFSTFWYLVFWLNDYIELFKTVPAYSWLLIYFFQLLKFTYLNIYKIVISVGLSVCLFVWS